MRRVLVAVVGISATLCLTRSSGRAQILVTNDNASGSGSFFDAVSQAALSPNSIIEFSGTDGNITLGSPLSISNSPTVNAANTTALTIPDAINLSGPLIMNMSGVRGTISGVIGDGAAPGSLNVQDSVGGGVLTLSGANTYSGGTTINGGATVGVNNTSALGTGAVTFNGGTLQTQAGLTGFSNAVTLTGAGTVDLDGSASTFSGAVSGAGALTITDSSSGGGGTLTLGGSNSGTGGLNITAGTGAGGVSVLAGATGALGSGGVAMLGGTSAANLNLEGYGQTIASLSGDAASTLDLNGAALSVGGSGTSTTFAGLIKDTAGTGSLTMASAGTLVLSGVNTYAGGTNLNAGTVGITNNGSLGTGAVMFNGGTLQTQAGLTGFSNAVSLAGAGTVDIDGNSSTFSGPITGAGALTVSNSVSGGVLMLSVANTYSGGTTINSGATVGVNNTSALGTGAVTFNGGTLQTQAGLTGFSNAISLAGAGTVDIDGNSSTFSGPITGAGALTVSNSGSGGVLTLSGANTYSGGTTINTGATVGINNTGALGTGAVTFNGGTLQTQAGLTGFSNAINLTAAGTVDQDGNSSTFTGSITGAGALTVSNSASGGVLSLSGANTYSGGTTINSGATVGINNTSALGTGGVTFNGGTLQTQAGLTGFANAISLSGAGTVDSDGNSSTFTGPITGAGALTVSNSGSGGVLALNGSDSYTGGTTINTGATVGVNNTSALGTGAVTFNGGTLQTQAGLTGFSNAISLAGAGTVDSDGNSSTFSGPITGAGALTVSNSASGGVLTLSGANTYSGGTTINTGATLGLTGTGGIGSGALNINGGTFELNGFSKSVPGGVTNNGTVNMGAATLTTPSYGGAGVLSVALAPSLTNLEVSGTANVSGGGLTVSNHPAPGSYTIINAGTLSGAFNSITTSPDYKETAVYSANQLTLTLAPTLASGAQTANERAVGQALFNISGGATGDLRAVLNQLDALSPAQANAALDQAGPMAMVAMGEMQFAASALQTAAVARHLADLPVGGAAPQTADGAAPAGADDLIASAGVGDTPEGWHDSVKTKDSGEYFASAIGSQGQINPLNGPSGAQPGYKFSSGGGTIGFNSPGTDDLVLGVALGFVGSAAEVGLGQGSVDSQSLRAGAFAAKRIDDFHANAYLGAALDSFSVTRNVAAINRDATSNPTGSELDFSGQAAYDLRVRRATLSPWVGLSSDQLEIAPTKETGAGAMDLSVAQQNDYSVRSDAGARLAYRFGGEKRSLTPFVSAAYEHEFMSQSRNIDAQFLSGPGTSFTVTTADIARSGMLLAAGFAFDFGNGASLQAEYSQDDRPNYNVNTLFIDLRARFR